jgi:hypothetical protein
VGRKVGREQGKTAFALIAEMEKTASELAGAKNMHLSAIADRLSSASLAQRGDAVDRAGLREQSGSGRRGLGVLPEAPGHHHRRLDDGASAQAASRQLEAGGVIRRSCAAKLLTARFYADHVLPQALSLSAITMRGADSVLAMEEALL